VTTLTGHDWRIVAPWYRWERADGLEPERAAAAALPAMHKYISTDFVRDFLADPQRSVKFDESVDVHFDTEDIPSSEIEVNGRLRSLSRKRLVSSERRKLFLAAHQRHYIVSVGLHCVDPGFPRVDAEQVAEVGFVIRRKHAPIPNAQLAAAAELMREVSVASALARNQAEFDSAKNRSRVLHPFRSSSRDRLLQPTRAATSAYQRVELAKRRLRAWAASEGIEAETEGWVPSGDGSFGAWVPLEDEPEELVERWHPMRLLTAVPDDPDHAALDGTIYYAAIPTASDDVCSDGTARFNAFDQYEIRVFVRPDRGDCPGPLLWSASSEPFHLASFYDPVGCAQRPIDVQLPDFGQLEASTALPSVKMTAPEGSSLEFAKFGAFPTKGKTGGGEVCFFSIPLITIVALFLLNIVLPIVVFIFQLFWMLKLKFCIPPSAQLEAELGGLLPDIDLGELSIDAEIDIDVAAGVNQTLLKAKVEQIFGSQEKVGSGPFDPFFDEVPPEWQAADPNQGLTSRYTNDPLVKLLAHQGYGSAATGGAPNFAPTVEYTSSVTRDQVVHP